LHVEGFFRIPIVVGIFHDARPRNATIRNCKRADFTGVATGGQNELRPARRELVDLVNAARFDEQSRVEFLVLNRVACGV
jgi:hypothetical protein